MKIICELLDVKLLKPSPDLKGWLVGIDKLSLHASRTFSLDELKEILLFARSNNQQVAINALKIFTTSELLEVVPLIKVLSELKVDYLFYTDLGFYQIAKQFQIPLVYQASTYLTNSDDVNLSLKENATVVISPELSLDEIVLICQKATKNVIIDAFGTRSIFTSRRKLISTYFDYRKILDLNPQEKAFTIVEEKRVDYYPIEEDENGTHIFLPAFYYLMEELMELTNVELLLIRTKLLTLVQASAVLEAYLSYLASGVNKIKQTNLSLTKANLDQTSVLLKGQGI